MNIKLEIRDIRMSDLEDYLYWKDPKREHHQFNGPYFKKSSVDEIIRQVEDMRKLFKSGHEKILTNSKILSNKVNNEMIGEVNWYWKSQETLWMEIGIVIFNETYWGKGIGCKALTMWIYEVFEKNPDLVRLGLTTWSGNERMMKLAEKLGFKKEAVYRKARIVNGKYYDSVSYGVLKEEWYSNKRAGGG